VLARELHLGGGEPSHLRDDGSGDGLVKLRHPGDHDLVLAALRAATNLDASQRDVG
jgi:hypothetical protein